MVTQTDTTASLVNGGSIRISPYVIEVRSAADLPPLIIDRHEVVSCKRSGTQVDILQRRRGVLTLQFYSLEDAGRVEASLSAREINGAAISGTSIGGTSISLPLALLVCAVLTVIGSIGPWARALIVTVPGTSGDGIITIVLGIVAGIFSGLLLQTPARRGWSAWLLCGAFLLAASISIYDWVNITRIFVASEGVVVAEWGIQLVAVSSLVGLALAVVHFRRVSESQ